MVMRGEWLPGPTPGEIEERILGHVTDCRRSVVQMRCPDGGFEAVICECGQMLFARGDFAVDCEHFRAIRSAEGRGETLTVETYSWTVVGWVHVA